MDWIGLLGYAGYVILGMSVAAYGTLIGAGGGFIIVPVLLLSPFLPYPHELAVGTSLTVVFFNALSGTFSYARQGRIDFWTGIRFAILTVPGAILGALLTQVFSGQVFNLLFGALLAAIALYLFFGGNRRPRSQSTPPPIGEESAQHLAPSARQSPVARAWQTLWHGDGVVRVEGSPLSPQWAVYRQFRTRTGEEESYRYLLWPGIIISFVVGFLSSVLGIGGGIIHVPAMVAILNFPPHLSTATSHFILVISSFTGVISHLLQPTLKTLPGQLVIGDVVIIPALLMSVGAVFGAQIGAQLSKRFGGQAIIRFLALALLLVGVRLMLPLS